MRIKHLIVLTLAFLLLACQPTEKKRVTIFYTADEHGWFNDSEKADGAAALMHLWKSREGFTYEADSFLVLSGGDMWTGSSVSTWFEGQSMYQVMQALGYDAAALGNHEFDFSLDTLKHRAKGSSFPYLAANMLNRKGEIPCFMKPWHIVEANGIKVGLLGLANVETPHTTNSQAVKNMTFIPYEEAIDKYVPELKENGAEMIIILGHICKAEMEALVPQAVEHGIPLITGGHCHQQVLEENNGVLLIESESYLRSYVKVIIEHNTKDNSNEVLSYEIVKNVTDGRDAEIQDIVAYWEEEANKSLNIPIGFTTNTIPKNSKLMHQLVMKSWANSFPDVDITITNTGGIRQDIEAGSITMADILGLLPFNNGLVQLKVSGAEMNDFISRIPEMGENYLWGEMNASSSYDNNKSYTLLTTDFLYALEETQFKKYDSAPYFSGMVYREPSIQWIRSLNTNQGNPLEKYLE